ncbi:hypothetical protein HZS_6930 [Henneguya salminicola]|uniref:Protein phosphatase 1 regulatory subunit 3A (Trinotate prediction) n=1 Tax=Henneguya salminicola TaxID=69463 RepID=A0A6G3MHS3_HENSL|nr:hypothetical protein HZS_6930 [Henneguya salminicola]
MELSLKSNEERAYKSLLKSTNVDQPCFEDKCLKTVSFADSKGQQLVDVKKFVPSSDNLLLSDSADSFNKIKTPSNGFDTFNHLHNDFKWITYFHNLDPTIKSYYEELAVKKVILESLSIFEPEVGGPQYLLGLIRVSNLAYKKNVFIRGSYQNWITQFEIMADFYAHCEETNTDLFQFKFQLLRDPSKICSKTLEFALGFTVNNCTYWDNNKGSNYRIYQI